jgi:Uma2 family endonuclease
MADRAILLTYCDYCKLPDDGRRYEIHDGELSVTPAPNPRHQRLVGAIYRALDAQVRSRGLGEVLLSPIDVILSDIAIVQPDVVYLERAQAGRVAGEERAALPPLGDLVLDAGALWREGAGAG